MAEERQTRIVSVHGGGGYSKDREETLKDHLDDTIKDSTLGNLLESTWTFVAGTTGAIAAHTLFTVTGNVQLTVYGVVDTTLDDVGVPTISVGTAGNVAAIIGVTTAKNLADGDVWVDTTDTRVGAAPVPTAYRFVINDGADIILNVLTATVSSGVIDFYCEWKPLSSGATVTVTTPA